MMKFHALVNQHAQELAELIVKENGKNITEALADGKFLVSTEKCTLPRPNTSHFWKMALVDGHFCCLVESGQGQ